MEHLAVRAMSPYVTWLKCNAFKDIIMKNSADTSIKVLTSLGIFIQRLAYQNIIFNWLVAV